MVGVKLGLLPGVEVGSVCSLSEVEYGKSQEIFMKAKYYHGTFGLSSGVRSSSKSF
jgi:hypothetical protein